MTRNVQLWRSFILMIIKGFGFILFSGIEVSNSRTLDYEVLSMKSQVKTTRPRRITLLVLSWTFFLFSSSKARTPVYAGFLLNETWKITNLSLVYNQSVQTVSWSIKGKGFNSVMGEGCKEFVKHKIVSLVGPNKGLLSGIGYLQSQYLSVPYIGIGLEPSFSYHGSNYISLGPSSSSQTAAIIGLAIEFGSPCITLFTTKDNVSALTALHFKEMAEKINSISIKVHEILLKDDPDRDDFIRISKEVLFMNKSGAGIVVLDCNAALAAYVQKVTASLEIPVEKFFWVVFDRTFDGNEQKKVSSVPLGVLKLQVPYTIDDLVADAMQLINSSIPSAHWLANSNLRNSSCSDSLKPWLDGSKLYKVMTNQVFNGKTGSVAFTNEGERKVTTFKILRMTKDGQHGKLWKKVGTAVDKKIHLESAFWEVNASYASSHVIKMVTSPDNPVVTVSRKGLLQNEQCTLSQLCIQFEEKPIPGTNRTQVHEIRKCCIGYAIDILELLKKDLGIHVKLYFVEDKYYGAYNATTKSWNGMVKDLIDGKAEIALTTLTIKESRSRVIDYSVPFLYGETKIMLGKKVKSWNKIEFGFLAPFHTNLWIVALVVINLVLIVVWSLDRISPLGHYRSHVDRRKHAFNIPACMSFIWSGVFKLELDSNASPRSVSARTTSAVFAFAMLMLVASYTANLAASLVTTTDVQVTNIKDSKFTDPSSGFKFATVKSSSSEMVFSRSSDPVFQNIYQNMLPYQVDSYPMAEEKLSSGAIEAFIDDSPFMDFLASRQPDCSFKIVGRPIKQNSYGFGFRKGSKWKTPISKLLLQYKKRDFFHRLRKKWFGGVCADKQETKAVAYQMEFKHFSGLFLSCSLAILSCFGLLIIEHFFYRFNRKILTTYTFDSSHNNSVRQMMQNGNSMVRIHRLRHMQHTDKGHKTLSLTNLHDSTNGIDHS